MAGRGARTSPTRSSRRSRCRGLSAPRPAARPGHRPPSGPGTAACPTTAPGMLPPRRPGRSAGDCPERSSQPWLRSLGISPVIGGLPGELGTDGTPRLAYLFLPHQRERKTGGICGTSTRVAGRLNSQVVTTRSGRSAPVAQSSLGSLAAVPVLGDRLGRYWWMPGAASALAGGEPEVAISSRHHDLPGELAGQGGSVAGL